MTPIHHLAAMRLAYQRHVFEYVFAALPYLLAAQGAHMGRLFTVCYLPLCAMMIALIVHYGPAVLDARKRVNFAFAGFTLVLLLVPVVGELLHGSQFVVTLSPTAAVLTIWDKSEYMLLR